MRHYYRVNLPLLSLERQIVRRLARNPQIKLGILFGSVGRGQGRVDSDLGLAVAADSPPDASDKMALIEEPAQLTGRPMTWWIYKPYRDRMLAERRKAWIGA